MKLYLVGAIWYSADQGDYPNTREFPSYCCATFEEALEKYEELAKEDSSWGFGSQKAYLVEATPGQPFKALRGDLRV